MSYQSEAQLEKNLIEDLVKRGYERVNISNIEDLLENFKNQLSKFNAEKLDNHFLSDKEFERVLIIINEKSVYESAKILRDKVLLTRDDETQVYLELFDSKDYTRNILQVTNQISVKGKYKNRYDVTLLLNGLPVVQIELKRRGMHIKEAFDQIERYRRHSYSGLFRYVQFYVISNGVDTKYYANSDGQALYAFTFPWTEKDNTKLNELADFSASFLDKNHLIKMISRYTIINEASKTLMVMRPYQVYATEALIKTALETNGSGFIWHTTGERVIIVTGCINALVSRVSGTLIKNNSCIA